MQDEQSSIETLLKVEGLKVTFKRGQIKAVNGVSFSISRGETLGLVGESGCGKSTLARAILRLTPLTEGTIEFKGKDFGTLRGSPLRLARKDIQMIFQDPYASLNPRLPVREIIGDPLKNDSTMNPAEISDRISALLALVGLQARTAESLPHELSGGQRQRVGIARALALNPDFIVCDEAISALDVSIQAQIINLLNNLQDTLSLTYLFIAHDLAVVRHLSDRIAVMYLGKIVELGTSDDICEDALHPYTQALLAAVPVPDPLKEKERFDSRIILKGDVSTISKDETGCVFAARCPKRERVLQQKGIDCGVVAPAYEEIKRGHLAACHLLQSHLE